MDRLNDLEHDVLHKLLAGDHPVLSALRAQAEKALVVKREATGVGFFSDFEVPRDLALLSSPRDFHIGDVNATLDGLKHGAGFVVFVRDGYLATLEGHSYEERWPGEIRNLKLTYQHEPRIFAFL